MTYNENDFTEENYIHLLNMMDTKTVFYTEINEKDDLLLLRHDVDFSVNRAYSLAKLEKEQDKKATYFFQLSSLFYNVFEIEIKNIIQKIIELGHDIGLHFDPTLYSINTERELVENLTFEKNILESLFNIEINVFSFHNPNEEIMKYDNFKYADMINTYASFFKEEVSYCSDSNGYWRHKRLEDFLKEGHRKMQVLTHPTWWQKDAMTPRNKIIRSINGRAKSVESFYDNLLKENGRNNVR